MCSALMMLLFLLSMDMFVMAGRSTSKISASVDAGKSAGNVLQALADEVHEAAGFLLPNDVAPPSPWPLVDTAGYLAENPGDAGWPAQLVTACYLTLSPQADTDVRGSGGVIHLVGDNAAMDRRKALTRVMLVFRGDADGRTNPNGGKCLWAWYFGGGAKTGEKLLASNLAPVWNAVNFTRSPASPSRSLLLKLVPAERTRNRDQSSDSNDAGGKPVSQLSGRSLTILNSSIGNGDPPPAPPGSTLPLPAAPTPTPEPISIG